MIRTEKNIPVLLNAWKILEISSPDMHCISLVMDNYRFSTPFSLNPQKIYVKMKT